MIDAGLHFVGDGQFDAVAFARHPAAVRQADRQLEIAFAGIAAENFVELFERVRSVDFFRHSNPHAARVARGEAFQRDDLVDNQVRFLAAGPFVDRAANDDNRVGLN